MVLGRVAPGGGVVKDHAVAVEYSPMTTPTTTHDLVIRGGLIVDGTGAPARRGDVAVQGGRLAEVDRFSELARAANRPVTLVSLRHNPSHPEEHRAILARIEALVRDGVAIYPQVTTSPLTATFDLSGAFVFFRFPVWKRVLDAPVTGWRALVWSFVNGRPVIQEGRMPDRPDPSEGRGPGRVLRAA
jgi:hypothetical protein